MKRRRGAVLPLRRIATREQDSASGSPRSLPHVPAKVTPRAADAVLRPWALRRGYLYAREGAGPFDLSRFFFAFLRVTDWSEIAFGAIDATHSRSVVSASRP